MVCELLEADDLNTSEPSKKKDREDSPKESKYIPIMGNKKGPQQDKEKQQKDRKELQKDRKEPQTDRKEPQKDRKEPQKDKKEPQKDKKEPQKDRKEPQKDKAKKEKLESEEVENGKPRRLEQCNKEESRNDCYKLMNRYQKESIVQEIVIIAFLPRIR